jgi:ABC-2 type transport system permease protein
VSALLLLLAHSLKRARLLTLTAGLLLAAFQVILIVVARGLERSGSFAQLGDLLPPFVRELMGPSLASFMSFAGIVCVGYIDLGVLGSLVALIIGLATVPVSEIETGYIDLILSRPLARHWIITRTVLVMILTTVFLLALMIAGTWIGLETLAPRTTPWPTAKVILSLALNLGLVMMCWGGVAMAIGCASRRRGVAGALAGVLALTTYLLDYVGRMWRPAEAVVWLSPFHYYSPFDLVMGSPLSVKNLLVLGAITITGFAASYVAFGRRDISH